MHFIKLIQVLSVAVTASSALAVERSMPEGTAILMSREAPELMGRQCMACLECPSCVKQCPWVLTSKNCSICGCLEYCLC
ncbi:hypothetical protein BGZ60DRAFT_422490 [Tricladium varicosporioides]|nr:hypothetical protein BGZ60DRAFT_422490 [Hymenoscyphus varicosporioides]